MAQNGQQSDISSNESLPRNNEASTEKNNEEISHLAQENAKTEVGTEKNMLSVGAQANEQKAVEMKKVKPLASQVDNWVNNGKPRDIFFDFGTPSSTLKSVGITDRSIQMDASKVLKILDEHKEMNIDIIKQLDKVVSDPVIILKSRATNAGNSFVI